MCRDEGHPLQGRLLRPDIGGNLQPVLMSGMLRIEDGRRSAMSCVRKERAAKGGEPDQQGPLLLPSWSGQLLTDEPYGSELCLHT